MHLKLHQAWRSSLSAVNLGVGTPWFERLFLAPRGQGPSPMDKTRAARPRGVSVSFFPGNDGARGGFARGFASALQSSSPPRLAGNFPFHERLCVW